MNNQQPPNGQVPDYRLQELQEQIRRQDEENRRLRQMFDQVIARQTQAPQPQQEERLFEEPVDRALDKKLQKTINPIVEQFKAQLGMLHDQNDMLRFQQMYGADTYQKYTDKIERLREERGRFGQYISREDAYKHIYYEETAKKAGLKPEPAQAPKAQGPVFDAYTGMMVNPEATAQQQPPPLQNGQPPVTPEYAAQVAAQQQPVPPQQMQQPQTQWQQPQQAPQPMMQQMPPLPPADMTPAGGQQQSGQRIGNLSLDADNRDLDAWASKYGDLPL